MWICFKGLRQAVSEVGIPLAMAVGWLVGLLGLLSLVSQPTRLDMAIGQVLSASPASGGPPAETPEHKKPKVEEDHYEEALHAVEPDIFRPYSSPNQHEQPRKRPQS